MEQIQATDMSSLRIVQAKTRRDGKRNDKVLKDAGVCKLQNTIETVKSKWFGHAMIKWEKGLALKFPRKL